jgi:subtilisin family serine protease
VNCPAPLTTTRICHNFSGTSNDPLYNFTLAGQSTARITFQWAEPRFGVTQDFDFFLINLANNTLVASSTDVNPSSGFPFEFIGVTNNGTSPANLALAVQRFAGSGTPRMKIVFSRTSPISNVQLPDAAGDTVGATIFGHNGAASEITTGATAFNDGVNPETFSSHGPMTILFAPVNGTIPAGPVSPVALNPDITATDGAANTFFGSPSGGAFRFFGTSQAAPHAAGVLALMRQSKPASTPDQLKCALTSSATPMNGGAAAVGAGRVNAVGALTSPRPNIGRAVIPVNAGRLQVNLTAGAGTFSAISPTGLTNASLEVNGVAVPVNQVVPLTGSGATVFVQRTGASGAFTARFNIVDACGVYPLFFGKGS